MPFVRAPDLYQKIVSAMEALGYERWTETLSFRAVPETRADRLFTVKPASVEAQTRLRAAEPGTYALVSPRTWTVDVLFRVAGSVLDILRERVLPEEERITDLLLSLDEAESVAAEYADADEGGGIIRLSLTLATRSDRPA